MFDINPKDVTGMTNRLLYNIWQELILLRSTAEGAGEKKPVDNALEDNQPSKQPKRKEKNPRTCKICEETFDNVGAFLAHSKSHQKEAK